MVWLSPSTLSILTHQGLFFLYAKGFFARLDEGNTDQFPLKFEMKNCKS